MALTITGIPDTRLYLGPSCQLKMIEITPAASDYTTGGYVITAQQCEFGNGHIYGAWVVNQQYGTTGYLWTVNLPTASYSTTNPQPSVTQFTVSVLGSPAVASTPASASAFAEVAASTDLSAFNVWIMVIGY